MGFAYPAAGTWAAGMTRTDNMASSKVVDLALSKRRRTLPSMLAYLRSTRNLVIAGLGVVFALCVSGFSESPKPILITSLKVDVVQGEVQVRIEADRELSIQTMALANPDRIVLDAAGTRFHVENPDLQINAGPVKRVRIGLSSSQPASTRIVVETSMPLGYGFRTDRNSALLEIPLPSSTQTPALSAAQPGSTRVSYRGGMLAIDAENSSLADILNAVQARVGGTAEFPPAAALERATVKLGPGPLVSVLASLLLGSPFDYVIVGSGQQSGGIRIVLSEKSAQPASQPGTTEAQASAQLATSGNEINEVRESATLASGEPAAPQPADGSQLMINQAPVGAMAREDASPDAEVSTYDSPDQDVQPRQAKPSRENPRIPPPGKGH